MAECTPNSVARGRALPGRAMRAAVLVAGLGSLAACSSLLDVKNPNNVLEGSLGGDPGVATAIANGAGATVNRALNNALSPYGAVTDELTYVGSRDAYGYADRGEVSDAFNEFADAAFPNMAEARYTAFNAVRLLKAFDAKTLPTERLADRNDLARTYIYEAVIFSAIGQIYDDFVVGSEKQTGAKPIGEGNMAQVFDSATAQASAALTIAQATSNKDLQIRALMIRAIAKQQKAIWGKLNGANGAPVSTASGVASPLVSDAGATADATAALALIGAGVDYKYKMQVRPENVGFPNIGNELNQRLELRMGDTQVSPSSLCRDANCDQYVIPGSGGNTVTGIKYKDPITNIVDPVLAATMVECCQKNSGNNDGNNIPIVVGSAREMLLILAEDKLATGDVNGFKTYINQLRALNSTLTPFTGTTVAEGTALLKHSRFVNLFNQGRRLADMHRFGIKAQKWATNAEAYSKACFFPIMNIERSSHPADFVNPLCRP